MLTSADLANRPVFRPVYVLLASNLFTLLVAIWQRWDILPLLWIYWGQSVVIGLFTVLRMLSLDLFTTDGMRWNGRNLPPTLSTKIHLTITFILGYGFFHAGCFVFLSIFSAKNEDVQLTGILICVAVFFVHHWLSWRQSRKEDHEGLPNISHIHAFPYLRILPMHLTLIIGAGFMDRYAFSLLLFMTLKTMADVAMHVIVHRLEHNKARGNKWGQSTINSNIRENVL